MVGWVVRNSSGYDPPAGGGFDLLRFRHLRRGYRAFVDDTRVIIDGQSTNEDGFEGATSAWSVTGPPEGSPGNDTEWQIGEKLLDLYAATSTDDTLLLGFGLEQLATDEDWVELLRRALNGLLR